MWWQGYFVQKGGALTHRLAGYNRGRMDCPDFLREGTVLRIWVSN